MALTLSTRNSNDLLNYIMSQDPALTEGLNLPNQKDSVAEYGKIILNSNRKKNAFINTVNLIALTLIVENDWENPWEAFTEQGRISYGMTVRELFIDLPEAQDYNEFMLNPTHFLQFQVPNVYNYFHDINFQKWYKQSINDVELGMAFINEEGIYDFIQKVKTNLYTKYKYDKYIMDKYMLQRRIIDGTVPSKQIANFDTNTVRQNVALMKEESNNMTFMSPKYNPAGVQKATTFENQRLIMSTGFEAQVSTEVLATSYFRNDAEFKTKASLIDGFGYNDWNELAKLIGDSFVPFTEAEIQKLNDVVGCIIEDGDRKNSFFKDFYYALDNQADTKETEMYNPEALIKNMWLHTWRIMSTSPFANCLCFTKDASAVTSVECEPQTLTVTKGQQAKLKAEVETEGITNKSVFWSIEDEIAELGAKIDQDGNLTIPSNYTGTDGTKDQTNISISTALASGEYVVIDGIKYEYSSGATTNINQARAIKELLMSKPEFTKYYTATWQSGSYVVKISENVGYEGRIGQPTVTASSDVALAKLTITHATEGVKGTNSFPVTATSIYDNTKSGSCVVTVV